MKADVEIVEFEPNDFLRSSDDYWDDDESELKKGENNGNL